jgi:transcription termination/antitermination protein NusG
MGPLLHYLLTGPKSRRFCGQADCKREGEAVSMMLRTKEGARLMFASTERSGVGQGHWYVLMVRANHEKRIAQGLEHRGIEYFLPCYRSRRQWKDRRVTLDLPLFPGYLFIRMPLDERLRVLTIPHVFSLVRTGSIPSTIDEAQIDSIRRCIEHGHVEPYPYLKVGEQVVITDGPMSGITGILLRHQNLTRVVVTVQSITRSFVLDIDTACVGSVQFSDTGLANRQA